MCSCIECMKYYPKPCRSHRRSLRQRVNLVIYKVCVIFGCKNLAKFLIW